MCSTSHGLPRLGRVSSWSIHTACSLLGAAIEAMAEAFTLAQKHGVPRRQTCDFFTQTLFDCFVYRAYGDLVASEHYQPVGARPSLTRKDYWLVLEAADGGQAQTPRA